MSLVVNQVSSRLSEAAQSHVTRSPTMSTASLIATAADVPAATNLDTIDRSDDTCKLLPGVLGFSIQFMLCVISITTLFLKYNLEFPKRPHNVFLMDFVTMMCGSGTVHVLNILSSILINRYQGGGSEQEDECNLYFMTTLFDSTFGIYIEYRIMRYLAIRDAAYSYLKLTRRSGFKPTTYELENATKIATFALSKTVEDTPKFDGNVEPKDPTVIEKPGEFDPEGAQLVFHGQSSLWQSIKEMVRSPVKWARSVENENFVEGLTTWLAIVCGLKLFSIALFTLVARLINSTGNFFLFFLRNHHTLKLIFVMIAAPLVLNVFQYCVMDSIMKLKTVEKHRLNGST